MTFSDSLQQKLHEKQQLESTKLFKNLQKIGKYLDVDNSNFVVIFENSSESVTVAIDNTLQRKAGYGYIQCVRQSRLWC